MKDLYYIFSEHGKVGPLDPFEIRAALRVGEVDPFDLASKEGSKIKRALVEIDEIFTTPENSFSDEDNLEVTLNRALGDNTPNRDVNYRPTESLIKTAQTTPLKNIRKKERKDAKKAKSVNKKDQKRYYIHTTKAKYGPFSARDIIEKYNLGDLSSSTTVQKVGVKMKIPIHKFVKIYQKNKNPNIKAKVSHSNFLENKELIIKVLWIMVGIAGALLIYFTLEKIKENRAAKTKARQSSQVREPKKVSRPAPVQSTSDRPEIIQPDLIEIRQPTYAPVKNIVVPKKRVVKKVTRPRRVTRKTAVRKKPRRIISKKPKKRPVRRRVVSAPRPKPRPKPYQPRSTLNVKSRSQKFTTIAKYSTKPSTKKVIKAKTVVKKAPVVKKKKSVKKIAPPKRSSSPSSSLGSIPSTAGREGQKLSFGPVSYSTSTLASCPAKCVLTFSGRGGTSIQATFFKARFGSQLSKKGGTASISGLVSSGNRFLLQKVN